MKLCLLDVRFDDCVLVAGNGDLLVQAVVRLHLAQLVNVVLALLGFFTDLSVHFVQAACL